MMKIPNTFSEQEEASLQARMTAVEMEVAYLKDEDYRLKAKLWREVKAVVFGMLEKYGKDSPEFEPFQETYHQILEFEASQDEEDE
ncbi:MAG: hypothetical protein HYU84_13805 [Chloroflexi bacterium]|nr:hypothetical protein [Chloroflexota bacterium]MBI3173199.1 hypothetical protein [Chloroflexota bacterium]